jgi:hypothetical protein
MGQEALRWSQVTIEKDLLRIICLNAPRPSQPIRHTIARCYLELFARADPKTLGETVSLLQSLIVSAKGAEGKETKL